jgi:hypothetical protein
MSEPKGYVTENLWFPCDDCGKKITHHTIHTCSPQIIPKPMRELSDEKIDYITKKYFNIHPEAKLSEQFKIKLYELEDFARAILKKANEK